MDLQDKKTAIYEALHPYLTQQQLDKAMQIWRDKYADKPTFALQHFVRECSIAFILEHRRNDMLQSLVESLTAVQLRLKGGTSDTPAASGQAPPAMSPAAPAPAPVPPPAQGPGFAVSPTFASPIIPSAAPAGPPMTEAERALPVFQMVVEQLCALAGGTVAREILKYLIDNLAPLKMPAPATLAVQNWLTGRTQAVGRVDIPVPTMQRLINLAYVALCEYCGPIKADTILDSAVRRVARTDPGCDFHPERLL